MIIEIQKLVQTKYNNIHFQSFIQFINRSKVSENFLWKWRPLIISDTEVIKSISLWISSGQIISSLLATFHIGNNNDIN